MARHVRTTAEATAPKPPEEPAAEQATPEAPEPAGVTFINNFQNRKLEFPDGSSYIFPATKVHITNPTLIANLREYAARPSSAIFIEE